MFPIKVEYQNDKDTPKMWSVGVMTENEDDFYKLYEALKTPLAEYDIFNDYCP